MSDPLHELCSSPIDFHPTLKEWGGGEGVRGWGGGGGGGGREPKE